MQECIFLLHYKWILLQTAAVKNHVVLSVVLLFINTVNPRRIHTPEYMHVYICTYIRISIHINAYTTHDMHLIYLMY